LSEPNFVLPPNRFRWLVSNNPAGTGRLDALLRKQFPGLSRRNLQELFSNHCVLINDRPAAKGARVSPGDLLEVTLPGPLNPFPIPDSAPPLKVYYQDSSLLILEKPGRIPAHPLNPFEKGTLANILISQWPQVIGIGNKPLEPGLVHRLDTGTSGLMAIALTRPAWNQLKRDLSAGNWRKIYLALAEGTIRDPVAIHHSLSHDPKNKRKMKVLRTEQESHRGRILTAETRIKPLRTYRTHTLVEAHLITGVTHQIRVHLAFQGHPIAGDSLYGATSGDSLGLPEDRLLLHAGHLSLPHPISRQPITCSSPLPEDFEKVLLTLGEDLSKKG
jgi:23S rRNA pseudouridine1911/1915/1917 synthase